MIDRVSSVLITKLPLFLLIPLNVYGMSARNRELMISEVNNTIKSVKLISKSGECARKILGKRKKMIRIRRQKSIQILSLRN